MLVSVFLNLSKSINLRDYLFLFFISGFYGVCFYINIAFSKFIPFFEECVKKRLDLVVHPNLPILIFVYIYILVAISTLELVNLCIV